MVCLFRGQQHSSDEIYDRSWIRGACLRGQRYPEAVVSQLVWRAVAEQGLRTDWRTKVGGERAAGGRRGGPAGEGGAGAGKRGWPPPGWLSAWVCGLPVRGGSL